MSTLDAWPGWLGLRALHDREAELRRHSRRHNLSSFERDEGRTIAKARAELRALYRARLRVELEDVADSLSVVKLQAEELVFDGLDLSSLNPDDLIELRRREPDWTPWGRT